jgi:HSP20 family molecular chaperone IbpA
MTTTPTDHESRALPPHANLTEDPTQYVVELDVSDFVADELDVIHHGRFLTVVGEHETATNEEPFSLHERLEETFSLPSDIVGWGVEAFYRRGMLEIKAPRCGPLPIERHVPVRTRPNGVINADATPC